MKKTKKKKTVKKARTVDIGTTVRDCTFHGPVVQIDGELVDCLHDLIVTLNIQSKTSLELAKAISLSNQEFSLLRIGD